MVQMFPQMSVSFIINHIYSLVGFKFNYRLAPETGLYPPKNRLSIYIHTRMISHIIIILDNLVRLA